jgi:hypothetical protein
MIAIDSEFGAHQRRRTAHAFPIKRLDKNGGFLEQMFGSSLNVAPIVDSGAELGTELLDPADPDEKMRMSQEVHLEEKREPSGDSW